MFCVLFCGVAILSVMLVAANAAFDIMSHINLRADALLIPFGIIPALIAVSAFSYFIFELFGSVISAVTGYFFITLGTCYISGCMYPLYAMPSALRNIAAFTPPGAARMLISAFASEKSPALPLLAVMLYSVLFFFLSVLVRRRRIMRGGN